MVFMYPDAPCMDYLPTLGEQWPHSRGNVGKYSLHGAFGVGKYIRKHPMHPTSCRLPRIQGRYMLETSAFHAEVSSVQNTPWLVV